MEPFIGTVLLTAVGYAPQGWALCDGTLLSVANNNTLFALLGTRYGGDGRTTFALPKLESPDGETQYIIAMTGVFPPRQ